jgi:DNA-binding MarR family transcriptional regulator
MNDATNGTGLRDTIAPRLGYLLRRASAAMMSDLGEHLAAVALRPVEATILILVGDNPGCIQSDLGRVLGIKRANMVPLVAGLAGRGLLVKSPVDGRSLALSLTEEGMKTRARAQDIMDAHEARFGALLGEKDKGGLRAALTIIAGSSGNEE